MKKLTLTLLLIALAATATAQRYFLVGDYYSAPPKRYIHLGYAFDQQIEFANPTFSPLGGKAEWAASFEAGTTYFVHRIPLAEMLRIGIDFSYLDAQYAQYNSTVGVMGPNNQLILTEETGRFASLGMQVGPSFTVSPARRIHLKAYLHYSPTLTLLSADDFKSALGGYMGYITGGANVSWRMLTIGWEARTGRAKLGAQDLSEGKLSDWIDNGLFSGEKYRVKAPSMRLYFGFRF